jgi:hypothetical protein
MLEDIVLNLVRGIGYFIFFALIELICYPTGEIVLYILSFGKKNPRWDYRTKDKPSKFVILTEISVWVGISFWASIFLIIIWYLGKH